MTRTDFASIIAGLQADLETVVGVFREKGLPHFGRPIIIGAILVLCAHQLIYKPGVKKANSLDAKIATAQSVSRYAEEFRAKRDRLSWSYSHLPRLEDREQWLFKSLVDSLKAENIVPEKLPPMAEAEMGGIITQQVSVGATVRFMEAVRWLNRIESGSPIIHINSVVIAKKQAAAIGANELNCEIATIIPKQRLDR
ncbi:MAG: hypothetical protein HY748_10225 [Elusimicrobia bacterium]|nr:hypothetical protein [Elusimicrobiota bacterium]